MRRASTFNRSVNSNHNSIAIFEPLELRRLLSASATAGIVFSERVDVPFTAELGTFVTSAPASSLSSDISWGDGTDSTGTIQPGGVIAAAGAAAGIPYQLDGSHTYDSAGRFPIQAAVYQTISSTLIRLVATFDDFAVVSKTNVVLNGTITGNYALTPANPGSVAGAGYDFTGTGTAGQLGPVSAHGLVTLPGPSTTTASTAAVTSLATGSLTLTSASASGSPVANSVTLEVTGVSEMGMFPSTLHYVVTSGTGAFAGASGAGTIAVTLGGPGDAQSFKFVIVSVLPSTVPLPTTSNVPLTSSDPITVELQPVVDSLSTLEFAQKKW